MFRFELFKGQLSKNSKVELLRNIGKAIYSDKEEVFSLFISSIEESKFWIIPEKDPTKKYDYIIYSTDSLGVRVVVGVGYLRFDDKEKYIQLSWDFYGHDNHFIKLESVSAKLLSLDKKIEEELFQQGERRAA